MSYSSLTCTPLEKDYTETHKRMGENNKKNTKERKCGSKDAKPSKVLMTCFDQNWIHFK